MMLFVLIALAIAMLWFTIVVTLPMLLYPEKVRAKLRMRAEVSGQNHMEFSNTFMRILGAILIAAPIAVVGALWWISR